MKRFQRFKEFVFFSLTGRFILSGLLILALFVPFIVVDKFYIVKRGNEALFLDQSRFTARLLADFIESGKSGRIAGNEAEIISILDGAILSGRIVYAEIENSGRFIQSTISAELNTLSFQDDLEFGEHGDQVYFIALPIMLGNGKTPAFLRLGFDEKQTQEMTHLSYINSLLLFSVYVFITLLFVIFFGKRLMQPINELRAASRRVASGAVDERLQVKSHLTEINDLATDLENMRRELVVQTKAVNLANRRLKEQQEKLLESEKMATIGQMAAAVAHSIRNPLASIRTSAELSTELPASDDIHEIAEDIIFEVDRVDQWIKEFLLFSRPGQDDINRIIYFDRLLEETLAGFVRTMEKIAIEYTIKTEKHLKLMFGDPTLLRQMLNSLIANAIEAMPDGGHLLGTAFNKDDSFIEITLQDTGKGIPEAIIPNIFKPFVSGKNNGVGIGLSQVKRIVEDHSGSIEVLSEVNRGTTIRIRFPAIAAESIEDSETVG